VNWQQKYQWVGGRQEGGGGRLPRIPEGVLYPALYGNLHQLNVSGISNTSTTRHWTGELCIQTLGQTKKDIGMVGLL
jgi:hypothetical protein